MVDIIIQVDSIVERYWLRGYFTHKNLSMLMKVMKKTEASLDKTEMDLANLQKALFWHNSELDGKYSA